FNDFMGEVIDSLLMLPAKYDELSQGLAKRLQEDFSHFGLGLSHLYINSVTPPPEVQQAIDDRSRMGVFKDMNKLMQMKAAMAVEKAAENDSSGEGMGAGLGVMMPAMLAQYFARPLAQGQPGAGAPTEGDFRCHECHQPISIHAKFCPSCGHQQLVITQCTQCGKNLTAGAKFCSRCGHPVAQKPQPKKCVRCGAENLGDATFCAQCGERY
ncbi:MAG: zinc-ribbon domain-containing protein, partial [Desulfobacterales bacterium]|nr:zinc-ribbon domain-containing protein [Desulfobacterales bacterium]